MARRYARGYKGRSVLLAIVALISVGVLAYFLYPVFFRTIPVESHPITWVSVESIRLGRAETSPQYYGTHVRDFRGVEVPILPRPEYLTAYTAGYADRYVPSRWEVKRPAFDQDSGRWVYGFNADVDAQDSNIPDISVVVVLNSGGYAAADYSIYVSVCAQGAREGFNSEYWWRWVDTWVTIDFDPYYLLERLEIDGTAVVLPPDFDRSGGYKWVVPVSTLFPSNPIASTFSLVERLFPYNVGTRCIVNAHRAIVYVDPSVRVDTAPTKALAPTLSISTAPTTFVAKNPTTITYTERITVTRTFTYSSVAYVWATTTVGGKTVTVTSVSTLSQPITAAKTLGEGYLKTVTAAAGETVTVTRYLTVTQEVLAEIIREIEKIPLWIWLVLGILFIFIVVLMAMTSAAVRRIQRTYRAPRRRVR